MNPPGPSSSLDSWLRRIERLSSHEIVFGLERVDSVLRRLSLRRPAQVIHVGGTNGKGSCVAMLEALCLAAGESTGSYTSPHVRRYNERIRVDGVAADDRSIVAAFERVEAVRGDLPLTYFEFGTLAALVVFNERRLDTVILEVGMGGRLDAVNAVEPDAGIITNVSLDHCDWLGEDVETIAAEKAGIMRASKPLVFGATQCPEAITRTAERVGADLRLAGRDFGYDEGDDGWSWRGAQLELAGLARPALRGTIQLQNGAAVLALLEAMGRQELLTPAFINDAWSVLELPGRMQRVCVGGEWLLDVAHNGASAAVLAAELAREHAEPRMTAIVGMLDDKDVASIVRPLAPLVRRWIAVTANSGRAIPAMELSRRVANVTGLPCLAADDVPAALDVAAERAEPGVPVLVTGSFYVVGPALDELYSRREA